MNNNHVNVNYRVEVCPEKFSNTKGIYEKHTITIKVYRSKKSYQFIGHHKFLRSIQGIPSLVIWTEQDVSPVFQGMRSQKLNLN